MAEVYIKNMVCNRCKIVVNDIFREVGVEVYSVELGKVIYKGELNQPQSDILKKALEEVGFEIIDDSRSKIIEEVKKTIIELVRNKIKEVTVNYSVYLERAIGKDYNYMSNLFTISEGQTIEHFIINQKIERVKELLVYEQFNLSEIAYELGYSSVSHLSNQFKKVTGLTPSHFKKIGISRRKSLDTI
nr:AraC family transcriptional regulator [uncultured Carboxylicivirga sp.]